MKTISVQIITPEKVILKEDTEFVVIPGLLGELGILPGHTRTLAQIKEGKVRLHTAQDTKVMMVAGGIAHIQPDSVELFTEIAEPWVQMPKEQKQEES